MMRSISSPSIKNKAPNCCGTSMPIRRKSAPESVLLHNCRISFSFTLRPGPLMPIMIHSWSALAQTDAFGNALWNARKIAFASSIFSWLIGSQKVAIPPSFKRLFINEKNCSVYRFTEPATFGGGGSPEIMSYCRGLA